MSSLSNGGKEIIQVDRLTQVAIGVQFIGSANVALGIGRGKNSDRNNAQLVVLFDLAKNVPGIGLRQIEIQKDQLGRRGVRIFALLLQKQKRFITIHSNLKCHGRLHIAQSLSHQANVARIVLDDEYYSSAVQ